MQSKKNLKESILKEYNMTYIDWLGYETTRFELHHIKKRENGGLLVRDNIAPLGKIDHRYIHIIEYKDLEMYLYLNTMLKIINQQGYMPTTAQLKAIDSVFKQFEREHSGDYNSKGEILIKEQYTKRIKL